MKTEPRLETELARVVRASSGRLLAALTSKCGDIQLAEDSLQDALVQANQQWGVKGFPGDPQAWLYTVARRGLVDRFRRSSRESNPLIQADVVEALLSEGADDEASATIPDERLKLIFTCCHPALSPEARVALTLSTLCGLTVREIARAYLVSETAMQQRLVRAKKKIRTAGIAYRVATTDELEQRLDSVLAAVYLIYNESYQAFEGQTLTREDLANEAIRLARLLSKLLPRPEVGGLLALMLLHHARRAARTDTQKAYIPLQTQDRSLWNQKLITEARAILLGAMAQGRVEKYQLQAAISALHSEANTWEQTDWQQIVLLYQTLYGIEASPVIKLNGLVAMAHTGQIKCAYGELIDLAETMRAYQPYFAARANIEAQLGLISEAQKNYRMAITLSKNDAEREYLQNCLVTINGSS